MHPVLFHPINTLPLFTELKLFSWDKTRGNPNHACLGSLVCDYDSQDAATVWASPHSQGVTKQELQQPLCP